MNVLSLFDGMSGAQIALNRAGIKYDKYFASEVDKYAIAVTQHNYPNTIQIGDVTKVKASDLPKIDLLIGGSPCQGLSFSGKQLNFNDPRSKLFFEFVRLLNELKPKYFILENVLMKQEYQDVISDNLGTQPVMINSALLSAQSRKRLYWTNFDVPQPEDKGIYLIDIIESGWTDSMKSYCIDANYFKGGNLKQYFEKSRRQLVLDKPNQVAFVGKNQQGRRVYGIDGKSVTLKANGGGWGAKMGLYTIPVTFSRHERLSGKVLDKSLPLEASNWRGLNRNQRQTEIARMINSGSIVIRKLTPVECERLQTVPDEYTSMGNFDGNAKKISNTQRYKMLGNGFTVDVIAHILKHINEN